MRVNRLPWGVVLLAALLSVRVEGVVRTVTVDGTSMSEVRLALGRSTVLHFSEKPIKVIAGNQNYFNIEFTGNDVTIQPLGTVVSNLFVYGEYRRYGFVLRVRTDSLYDDLVQVRWAAKPSIPYQRSPSKIVSPKEKLLNGAALTLLKAMHDKPLGIYVVDVEIKGDPKEVLSAKDVHFSLFQGRKEIPIKQLVFNMDSSGPPKPVLQARLIVDAKTGKATQLKVRYQRKSFELALGEGVFR